MSNRKKVKGIDPKHVIYDEVMKMDDQPTRKGHFVPQTPEKGPERLPEGLREQMGITGTPEPPEALYDPSEPISDDIHEMQLAAPGARTELLQAAAMIVEGDRDVAYGAPEDSFGTIAELWSTYLRQEVLPQDVAAMMTLLKVARIRVNPAHRDSWVDIAGYAACGGTMPLPEVVDYETDDDQ